MVDSCYVCKRTQADLDRLNEEIRTRVYLEYFSNARNQIDEQQRKFAFLQRIKDAEGSDPHFRISAQQVFGDPKAYEKLMPWIETVIQVADAAGLRPDPQRTMGELIEQLLLEERHVAAKMEQGLNQLRSGFASGGKSPFSLQPVSRAFPVEWSLEGYPFPWQEKESGGPEPLLRQPATSKATVTVPLHLCTVCQELFRRPAGLSSG